MRMEQQSGAVVGDLKFMVVIGREIMNTRAPSCGQGHKGPITMTRDVCLMFLLASGAFSFIYKQVIGRPAARGLC